MLKDNHEIGVKIVIGNSRILIGKKTRSQHWQLNSYSFLCPSITEFCWQLIADYGLTNNYTLVLFL